ncbi:hypothetical protein [Burkholderia stagnalis]|uniref:hypothetical protein n=1 Tax=Burkholderia stagnalis TaxID=1503054 RepID=UPI0012DA40D9|nr:hypothetical protein [Burkholderia stagnalis]
MATTIATDSAGTSSKRHRPFLVLGHGIEPVPPASPVMIDIATMISTASTIVPLATSPNTYSSAAAHRD